jgi:hypothetical protein
MGMYRSGTTRLYNVIREALAATRGDAVMTGHFPDAGDLERMLEAPGPCVFKDHEPTAPVVERIVTGDLLAVGSVRPPLEAMISFAATFDWAIDEIVSHLEASVQALERLGGDIVLVPYAEAISGNWLVIRRTLGRLGLDVSIGRAAVLAHRWSRHRGIASSRAPGRRAGREPFDPETLFHPNHVGGRRGRQVDPEVRRQLEAAVVERDLAARVARLIAHPAVAGRGPA